MTYDFDKIIDRRDTGALKVDVLGERYGRPDLLPLWVADMDFETPSFITDACAAALTTRSSATPSSLRNIGPQ